MGVYLSTPKTEKVSEDGENDKLKFGLSSMQGWRATMEDAVSFYSSFKFACCDFLCRLFLVLRFTWIDTQVMDIQLSMILLDFPNIIWNPTLI